MKKEEFVSELYPITKAPSSSITYVVIQFI